jgi:hypothetical protein
MHPEMRNLFLVLVASALTPNLSCLAQTPFTQDAYIRFERDGYRGNVYLNEDGTYVIVQTGPDHATRSFGGKWRRHGESGFCIEPERDSAGKCFTQMPTAFDQEMTVRSNLGETYRVILKAGR